MWNYIKLEPAVQVEMSFKKKFNDDGRRRTKIDHNSSPRVFGKGELLKGFLFLIKIIAKLERT